MSDSNFVRPSLMAEDDRVTEALLDVSSLTTVIAMLEVIDSVDELALLETLTPAQKRQVWEVTPEATRMRLIQLRTATEQVKSAEPQPDTDADSTLEDEAIAADWLLATEESTSIDLEALEEIDLSLQDALNQSNRPPIEVGNWIVLQAKPKLTRLELMAIWEVTAVRDSYAQIKTEKLGTRIYPITWMTIYPKPIDIEPEF